MDIKEIIKAVLSKVLTPEEKKALKDLQTKLEVAPPAPPAPKEVKTLDGKTLLVTGDLIKGSAVTVDGAPADGSFETEEGTIVCVAGLITEVKPKAEAEVPAPAAEMAAQMSAHKKAIELQLSDVKKENTELKASVLELTKMIDKIANAPIDTQLSSPKVEKTEAEMSNAEIVRFKRGEKIYK